MSVYENIKPWLEQSERNEYFFRNPENVKTIRSLHREYSAVAKLLHEALDRPMTREHYLDWRKAWRAAYAKLSAEIRWMKGGRKTTQLPEDLAYANAYAARFLRETAAHFMWLRSLSKEEAAKAYVISKEARAAA